MTSSYYTFDRERSIEGRDLTIPRAIGLGSAVERHPDFQLIAHSRISSADDKLIECLTVEVTCDGIPHKNAFGLQYRERLCLWVSCEPEDIVSVFAMRKDFPRLVHQHQTLAGSPAHLCLYFEPNAAVRRTWTPQSFLRRIVWWLEKSSRGELHPADQPVEQLFFATRNEILLPWNFDALRGTTGQRFVLGDIKTRPDGGITLSIAPLSAGYQKPAAQAFESVLIDLTLPPVVSGVVESDPTTLGELSDILEARGIALLPPLRQALQQRVPSQGVKEAKAYTVVILHIPIVRELGAAEERRTNRAFLLPDDAVKLGLATGALFAHEGRAYSSEGVLAQPDNTSWRILPVAPTAVLRENTPFAARFQSGIADAGPEGVIVGAGALGSALTNLWARGGWGRWTVIDSDHIKPHNLSRHTAMVEQIGTPKAQAVGALNHAITGGASTIVAIVSDACDQSNPAIKEALEKAGLVVDASASLEYPRQASTIDGYARHASVFITPTARAGAALVEDAARTLRLRTLEAQYYRALIQSPWGQDHLGIQAGTFWSGTSCRDISFVLPYSKVLMHASILAEFLPPLIASPGASIRIWQREDDRGGLVVHDISVEPEHHFVAGELDVYLDDGVVQRLRDLRRRNFPNETGGALLGYYDFNVNQLVIVLGLPAPPDSRSTPGSFERGVEGLKVAVMEAARRTAGIVNYVGEWHSHPPGCAANPSDDDWIQLIHLALNMGDDGLPGIQLIIGEGDLQLLQGHSV